MPDAGYSRATEADIIAIDTATLADETVLFAFDTHKCYQLDKSLSSGGDLTPTTGSGRWVLAVARGLRTVLDVNLGTSATYSANTFTDVVYDTVVTDADSAYNSSTGEFTQPSGVTTTYLLMVNARQQTGSPSAVDFRIAIDTGSGYGALLNHASSSISGVANPSFEIPTSIISLDGGDKLKLQEFPVGNANTFVVGTTSFWQMLEIF